MTTSGARIALGIWTALVLFFLWAPLVLIGIYAFNRSAIQSWPIPGWTLHWFRVAWNDPDVRSSLWLSVKVGLLATGIALVLVWRFSGAPCFHGPVPLGPSLVFVDASNQGMN